MKAKRDAQGWPEIDPANALLFAVGLLFVGIVVSLVMESAGQPAGGLGILVVTAGGSSGVIIGVYRQLRRRA